MVMRLPSRKRCTNLPSLTARRPKVVSAISACRQYSAIWLRIGSFFIGRVLGQAGGQQRITHISYHHLPTLGKCGETPPRKCGAIAYGVFYAVRTRTLFVSRDIPTGRPCERRDPYGEDSRFWRWSRGLFSLLRPGVMGPCVPRDDPLRACARPRLINARLNSV